MRRCYKRDCAKKSYPIQAKTLMRDYMIVVFYTLYRCINKHISYVCKKCGVAERRPDSIHVAICIVGFDIFIGEVCTYKKLSDSQKSAFKRHIIFGPNDEVGIGIGIGTLVNLIPQVIYTDIKSFINLCEYNEEYVTDYATVEKRNIWFTKRVIKSGAVPCILCGMIYDSFPTMEMIYGHLLRCATRV